MDQVQLKKIINKYGPKYSIITGQLLTQIQHNYRPGMDQI